jgi:hypothetical protein
VFSQLGYLGLNQLGIDPADFPVSLPCPFVWVVPDEKVVAL